MAQANKRIRRQALHGWWKWTPVVVLVFSVIYFDCWLDVQRRSQDYEIGKLNADIDNAQREIDEYMTKTAGLETFDRLERMAPALGLQLPEPGQIKVIRFDPESGKGAFDTYPFSIARADETDPAAPPLARAATDIGAELPEAAEIWD